MLCSIADVYDAMRSQRAYQQAFPSERILEVMKRNDGHQFDQNLVRLDDGAMAVVMAVHAPEPFKPRVKVIATPAGEPIETPYEINLWEGTAETPGPKAVTAPLDPAVHGVDPLTYL